MTTEPPQPAPSRLLQELRALIDAHEPVRWTAGRRCHCTCGALVEDWAGHLAEVLAAVCRIG